MAVVQRSVVVASADAQLRRRVTKRLTDMRWQVREAGGGAEAMACLEQQATEVLLLDHWLPDLEVGELARQIQDMYPEVEVLDVNGQIVAAAWRDGPKREPHRELLHALRDGGDAARGIAGAEQERHAGFEPGAPPDRRVSAAAEDADQGRVMGPVIEGMVGSSAAMQEMARLIQLVAPRSTTVLIEGETGTGKELVAKAVHRWSARANKPFAVLNCAAIPEALLEAELFGHTRGAFTGAVQSRTGRIEAAHGGTLFLDEIGEMPLALQAKMLRFLESGELQRVGENETLRVDVRVVAATHQHLERRVLEGGFRMDLYHRLAVFVLDVPPLRQRREDIAALCEHFLAELGRSSPRKRMSPELLEKLKEHEWPGNVRELAHVLERAVILAGDTPTLDVSHLRQRRFQN
jgi:DNA-binding NtrC family response regulator